MSKELTPLEALKKLRQNWIDETHLFDDELLDILETALKDYEMEHTLRVRLENINYELVREKQENDKKLKVLEIIKEKRVNVLELFTCANYETYMSFFKKWNWNGEYDNFIITQEEYDLLNEVLVGSRRKRWTLYIPTNKALDNFEFKLSDEEVEDIDKVDIGGTIFVRKDRKD